MTIDEINALQDVRGWERAFQVKKTPKAKKQKGFLQDQISTGGGIAGALAGGAGGAAIGSVVPVVGTAVGGLLGAILGGAAGSAGGEVAENYMAGEEDKFKNVLNEGLIGGATSLPITGGLKLAGAGLKATTGFGSKTAGQLVKEAGTTAIPRRLTGLQAKAASELSQGVGTTAAQNAGSRFSLTGRLEDMGNKALLSQYGTIGKNVARSTNPTKTISTLADAGIVKPDDAARIASGITGSDGLLSRAVSDAVGNANTVDTSTLRRVFNDSLDTYGIVDKDRKSLMAVFEAQMKRTNGGARGSLDPKVNATDAMSMMKALEQRVANLQGKGGSYGMPTPERIDQANVLKLVRDELQDQIYTGAGANANLSNILTPQLRERLVALQPGNAKWANYVDNSVMKATDIGQLRSAQAPLVNASKIMEEADVNALTFGGRAGNAFAGGGLRDMVGGAVTNLVKDPVARASGQTLRRAGGGSLPSASRAGQSLLGAGVRQAGGRGLAGALTAQEQPPMDEEMSGADLTGYEGETVDPTMGQPTNPFGISLSDVAAQMRVALENGDLKGYSTLGDLYDRINEFESSGGGEGFNSTVAGQLAMSDNGLNTLNQLEQLYGSAGGAQGKIGGGFQSFLAKNSDLNSQGGAYIDLAGSAETQIAKAIAGGGQVSDADAAAIRRAIPQLTDTPQQAAVKFRDLRARLQKARQNTMMYNSGGGGGGQTDLASVLNQAGY